MKTTEGTVWIVEVSPTSDYRPKIKDIHTEESLAWMSAAGLCIKDAWNEDGQLYEDLDAEMTEILFAYYEGRFERVVGLWNESSLDFDLRITVTEYFNFVPKVAEITQRKQEKIAQCVEIYNRIDTPVVEKEKPNLDKRLKKAKKLVAKLEQMKKELDDDGRGASS